MKKVFMLSICMVIMLLLSACHLRVKYDYLYSEIEVSSVTIVQLSFVETDMVQTEVCTIDDKSSFVARLNDLPCFLWQGEPIPATPEGTAATVFKISYNDSSYELINWNGQSKYTVERGMEYYAGGRRFDEAAFMALLEDYLG